MATGSKDLEVPPVRRYVRRPIAVRITGKAEAGLGHLFFDSQDLSLGGAFLKAELLLEIGEELSLELRLPAHPPIDARARVAWVRRGEGTGGMGIEFTNLTTEDKTQLARFLDGT